MPKTYSTYEAKARFSELLRRVRAGERVTITSHGEPVAELRPIEAVEETFEQRVARLELEGRLVPAVPGSEGRPLGIRPVAHRPGALQRFLAGR